MSHALPGETLYAMPAPGSLLRYLKSLLISSGEFLEACFDKIDEFRQRDTSQLAAG
jgi:hypothetical protein